MTRSSPNGDFVEQWYPDDPDGALHKVQLGFEFGDQAYGCERTGVTQPSARTWPATPPRAGVKKQARYRPDLGAPRRASPGTPRLHQHLQPRGGGAHQRGIGTEAYTRALTNAVDVEEWFKGDVVQHLYNNYDSFSYGGGQNAFAYKPERGTWSYSSGTTTFAFGGPANDANVFSIGGADHGPRNDHPPFARIYLAGAHRSRDGMMTAARSNPILDSRYNGMVAGAPLSEVRKGSRTS